VRDDHGTDGIINIIHIELRWDTESTLDALPDKLAVGENATAGVGDPDGIGSLIAFNMDEPIS